MKIKSVQSQVFAAVVALTLASLSTPAFAQVLDVPSDVSVLNAKRSVKDIMQEMGQATRSLSGALRANPVVSADATLAAELLKSLALESHLVFPKAVTEANDKGLSQATYQRLLLAIATEALKISEAVIKQDIAAANASLRAIGQLRTEGHELFKLD